MNAQEDSNEMTKKLIQDSSQSGRKPVNQARNTAGSRDGTPGSQPARRGGKATQAVTRAQDTPTKAQNGPPAIITTAPAEDAKPSGPTFNIDEITKMLESGVDANAEVYKPPKSSTKSGAPPSPWAPKPGQMANGKDFFTELRKQVVEKMAERDQEEKGKDKEGGPPAKGG